MLPAPGVMEVTLSAQADRVHGGRADSDRGYAVEPKDNRNPTTGEWEDFSGLSEWVLHCPVCARGV